MIMEINGRKCKICKKIKQRIEDGTYPNGRDKRWKDEDNLLWSGNVCGKCNQSRAKVVMKKARSSEKN